MRRWSIEATVAEVRPPPGGVETQRPWSDPAIARTTPLPLGLFSWITLWADGLAATGLMPPRRAAWYPKPTLPFSGALAAVRSVLWASAVCPTSADHADVAKIPRATLQRLTRAACFPA